MAPCEKRTKVIKRAYFFFFFLDFHFKLVLVIFGITQMFIWCDSLQIFFFACFTSQGTIHNSTTYCLCNPDQRATCFISNLLLIVILLLKGITASVLCYFFSYRLH